MATFSGDPVKRGAGETASRTPLTTTARDDAPANIPGTAAITEEEHSSCLPSRQLGTGPAGGQRELAGTTIAD